MTLGFGPRKAGMAVNERRCESCGHFLPAYTCIEKPTWGHCAWPGHDQAGGKKTKGLFTWADDTCSHFCDARKPAVQRDFTHSGDPLT